MEPPLLPFHHVALELEAWTCRLIDPHRAGHRTRLADRGQVVVGNSLGQRHDTLINHPEYLFGIEVNDSGKTCDLARVLITDSSCVGALKPERFNAAAAP